MRPVHLHDLGSRERHQRLEVRMGRRVEPIERSQMRPSALLNTERRPGASHTTPPYCDILHLQREQRQEQHVDRRRPDRLRTASDPAPANRNVASPACVTIG